MTVFQELLLTIAKILEQKKIPYAIVGGVAAIAWGRSRTTYDIDVIIDHKNISIKDLVTIFSSMELYVNQTDLEDAFAEKTHVSLISKQDGKYRVDLKGIYTQLDREAIQTAKEVVFDGQKISIGAPENLIAHKLKFDSERDLEDAFVVFLSSKEQINMKYLENLVERLDVEKSYKKLLYEVNEELKRTKN